jgi:hypothetical protein
MLLPGDRNKILIVRQASQLMGWHVNCNVPGRGSQRTGQEMSGQTSDSEPLCTRRRRPDEIA